MENRNLSKATYRDEVGLAFPANSSAVLAHSAAQLPLLRIPPFPGASLHAFVEMPVEEETNPEALIEALKRFRIGGAYWAGQPDLPEKAVLVRSFAALDAATERFPGRPIVIWAVEADRADHSRAACVITDESDPWHMLSGALALVANGEDDLSLIASLLGVACYDFEPVNGTIEPADVDALSLARKMLSGIGFENPFTGEEMTSLETIELCGFWRQLIDSNRDICAGIGFAFWKQSHVAPLLWGGSVPFQFLRSLDGAMAASPVAVWRSKVAPAAVAELERRNVALIEVEDGFLRSRGLGADCVPPLSITVDRLGAHFDPSGPSELEILLQEGAFDEQLCARAKELRRLIVDAGIGKYESGVAALDRPGGGRRHVLVPGQVEDDRAVQVGGCGLVSNLDLLARVRQQVPDAYILYKPHPDVVAGHRRGAIADDLCLAHADKIIGEVPIASLIAMVDEIHVNTSLAGFEALLRDKPVTTYGVPFYAGWGLTTDLGPVPARRTASRTIDELVAATLLVYPRYLDPMTGLPCPAEIVAARLSVTEERSAGFIVGMRRLQGRLMRRLRSLVQ
jgi:capsular polysaccharide export protein